MELKQHIDKLVADTEKEIDRLSDRRAEDLGNCVNYVINELDIEHLNGKLEGLREIREML